METIKIDDLTCACVAHDTSSRVIYMIYPKVAGFSQQWIEQQAKRNNCSIVMIYVPLDKWNDYLTPWPEPGETPKAQPFAGDGAKFLNFLRSEIIPQAEKALGVANVTERDLIGVSLAGLFTLWQWVQCDTFRSIACLSGSFWYMDFMDWFNQQAIPYKNGKAYFLLGKDEPKAHIKAYRSVGVNTEAVVARLKATGIATTFQWVAGNHFTDPLSRAEKALNELHSTK